MYLQHLALVKPLLLPAAIVDELELYLQHLALPDAVDTFVCAPDDGWRYHPKHVEQFPESCWIYIRICPVPISFDVSQRNDQKRMTIVSSVKYFEGSPRTTALRLLNIHLIEDRE